MKILSIDDSKAVHAYLTECLKASPGVTLEHAFNGAEGLKMVSGAEFDLVLLDWEMPGLTGPEVLTEIRKANAEVPVIMLTSKNAVGDIENVLSRGASEYIMKPFTADILFAKIESVTGVAVQSDGAN